MRVLENIKINWNASWLVIAACLFWSIGQSFHICFIATCRAGCKAARYLLSQPLLVAMSCYCLFLQMILTKCTDPALATLYGSCQLWFFYVLNVFRNCLCRLVLFLQTIVCHFAVFINAISLPFCSINACLDRLLYTCLCVCLWT